MENSDYDFFRGKTILVTGGTGYFGQHFVETLITKYNPKKVIVFSRDEFKQHEMRQRFNVDFNHPTLRFFIGDVRDLSRLERAFKGVDIVVHAAALKQVPALEYNPFEAIKTNILGTQNVIEAAINSGVQKTILISTDKAASPANLYGATKLCAEKIVIAGNAYDGSRHSTFSVVRYGNVIGSRGSIMEVIHKQKNSGVVTLTEKEMTRFWITVNEAIDLVLYAIPIMRGGEIFVPKIPSMKIVDFISYFAPDCKIKVIGIRPGEKLHETLITEEEAMHVVEFKNYFVIKPNFDWWDGNHLNGGKKVKKGMRYDSLTNKQWLKPQNLKSIENYISI